MSDTTTTTLVLALIGVVLSVASLVWQAATFKLEGPRVRVELQAGAMNAGELARAPLKGNWWKSLQGMQKQGLTRPVAVVVIRNVGRAPTTVTGYALKTDSGMSFSLTGAPPGTPPLPHRLEADSMVVYHLGLAEAAALVDAATGTGMNSRSVMATVDLGSGRTLVSKERFDAKDLLALLPALRGG